MRANILVVDDQPEIRFLIGANLRRHFKFQVTEADSVQSAVKHLHRSKFELIVSDFMMPSASGLDLLGYVERHPELNCHFILFTSAADQITEEEKERVIVIDKCRIDELIDTIRFLGVTHGI